MIKKPEIIELDKKDRKLLAELDYNSRQNFSELGKKLELSKDAVKYRLNRLKRKKIITGFYTELNMSKLGYIGFRVYMKYENINEKVENEIIGFLVKEKDTWWVATTIGRFNIGFLIWKKTIEDFEEFWNKFKLKFKKYLEDYRVSIYTNLYSYNRKYLQDNPEKFRKSLLIGGFPIKIDKIDGEILKQLSENTRTSLVEIASKLKTNPKNISYRLKRLIKKGIILAFRTKIDISKLGYEYRKVDINLNEISQLEKIREHIDRQKNVVYFETTFGGTDFEFDIEIKNYDEYISLINELKNKFPGTIKDFEYFLLYKNHKLLFMSL